MKYTNKRYFFLLTALTLSLIFCGCGTKKAEESTQTEITDASQIQAVVFPATYTEVFDNCEYNFTLEIPDGFQSSNLHQAKIASLSDSNMEEAWAIFGNGQPPKEEHQNQSPESASVQYIYLWGENSDNTLSAGGSSFSYVDQEYIHYNRVMDSYLEIDTQDLLPSLSAGDAISELKTIFEKVGLESDIVCDYTALDQEQLAALENHINIDGTLQMDKYKSDWDEEDAAYVIWGSQVYEGLPVYNHYMFNSRNFAFDERLSSQVMAIRNADRWIYIQSSVNYELQELESYCQLLPFEDIIAAANEKFGKLLSEEGFLVSRAKLFQMVWKNEKGQMETAPGWYFEYTNKSDAYGSSVLLINACTGEELSKW